MRFLSSISLLALLTTTTTANPLVPRNDDGGLPKICKHLKTKDNGCIRYVTGFDITGATTEIVFTFPEVKNKCDCIQKCLDSSFNGLSNCANYVWKFTDTSNHRTCTLYSDFNLPPAVTVSYDFANSIDILPDVIVANSNQPHKGGPVPEAFEQGLTTLGDDEAVSGPVWLLQSGDVLC